MKTTTKNKRSLLIINGLGYYIGWWACIAGAVWSFPWLGPFIMLLFILFHFRTLGNSPAEKMFLVVGTIIGTVADSTMAATNFIDYNGGYPGINWLAPLWITAMWIGFNGTLNHSMSWLGRKRLLAAVLGFIFGPVTYFGGQKLGALTLTQEIWLSVVVLGVVWGILLPLLFWLSDYIKVRQEGAVVSETV